MASTYSNLKIQLMATGENSTTWGNVTNVNLGTALEEAIVGSADVTFASGNVTLTLTDTNSTQTARNMRLRCTGTTGGSTRNLVVPSIEKPYIVQNDCADSVVVKTAAGTGITVPAGKTMWVYSDATNVVDAVTHLTSLTLGTSLVATSGGTGQNVYAVGDLLYASTTTALSRLADVATGNALISGGVGVAPSYGKIGLTTHVNGTLPVANGGTNLTSYTTGDIVYASGSTTLASLADVATGNALISGGVGVAPSYGKIGLTTHISGTLAVGNGGTGAVTLTGYVKGTGTSAMTASATIPNTDITGLGTMSTQNASTVTITGGTITGITDLAVADGGTGASTAAGARTNLGSTTLGANLFTITDPSAVTFPRFNADNTVSALDAASFRTAIGAGTGGGSVSSVGMSTGTTGLSVSSDTTNPITGTGTFTLSGTLIAANGGTGQNSYVVGDILYASTTSALSKLADVAAGNALISGGVGVAPSYGKIGLTTHVSGTLDSGNGGTGLTTFTAANNAIYSTSSSTLTAGTLPVTAGGTGGTTQATARSGIGAAASGANTDITALNQDVTVTASGTSANNSIGYRGMPQSTNTTLALADAGKHIYTASNVTIPASSTAFPIGTVISIVNSGASTLTISITTDTLRQAGTTNTGTRTLAAYGVATVVKVANTVWYISGNIT